METPQRHANASQGESVTHNLITDFNLKELLAKISTFMPLDFCHSKDETELITSEYLEYQIVKLVQTRRRIKVIDLPKLLNVDPVEIDQRLKRVLERFPQIDLREGNLLSERYFDELCEQIDWELQQKQSISFSSFTIEYELSHELLHEAIESRIPNIIKGEIYNRTILVSLSYRSILKAQLRGILRACTRSITVLEIRDILTMIGFPLSKMIAELIMNKEVDGQLVNGVYISEKFITDREKAVREFFRLNDYVGYDFLSNNLYVTNPKQFLKELFSDSQAVYLQSCIYSFKRLADLKNSTYDLLHTDGYVELRAFTPGVFTSYDIEILITKYLEIKDYVFQKDIMFSVDYLDKCADIFREQFVGELSSNPCKLISADLHVSEGKGKKGRKKSNELEKKLDSFKETQVLSKLREQKLLPADPEPQLEAILFGLLRERLHKLREKVDVEARESKKTFAIDLIDDIKSDVEEKISLLQLVLRSMNNVSSVPNLNIVYLNEKVIGFTKPVVESMLIYYCRKYKIQLPQTWFKPGKTSVEQAEAPLNPTYQSKFVKMTHESIFKSTDLLYQAADQLPKELRKPIRDLLNQKSLGEFMKILQENVEALDLKIVNMEKKNEKTMLNSQKKLVKDAILKANFTLKEKFFYLLEWFLLDQCLFFGLEHQEKAISLMSASFFGVLQRISHLR